MYKLGTIWIKINYIKTPYNTAQQGNMKNTEEEKKTNTKANVKPEPYHKPRCGGAEAGNRGPIVGRTPLTL